MKDQRPRVLMSVAALAVIVAGCTGDAPRTGPAPSALGDSQSSPSSPSASGSMPTEVEDTTRAAAPLPVVSGQFDGMAAAREVLNRPDVRPEYGWLSEDGHLVVTWRVMQPGALCRTPEVVTWLPYRAWRHGIRRERVRAWLLARGQREVLSAGAGFLLEASSCNTRGGIGIGRPLLINGRGRALETHVARGPVPPRQGMLSTGCITRASGAPRQGSCELDPESGHMWRLERLHHWFGPWDDATSILWGPPSHISGTWSVDGGATWHQTWDPWDATVARWEGETYVFSNSMGGNVSAASSVYRLPAGVDMRSHPHGVGPPDLINTGIVLPKSADGYRHWSLTDHGVLLGTTHSPVLYVSQGSDWSNIIRRETDFVPDTVTGRFLVAQSAARSGPWKKPRILRVSTDYGSSWTTLDLSEVRP
jgi:hypothetical protein